MEGTICLPGLTLTLAPHELEDVSTTFTVRIWGRFVLLILTLTLLANARDPHYPVK